MLKLPEMSSQPEEKREVALPVKPKLPLLPLQLPSKRRESSRPRRRPPLLLEQLMKLLLKKKESHYSKLLLTRREQQSNTGEKWINKM